MTTKDTQIDNASLEEIFENNTRLFLDKAKSYFQDNKKTQIRDFFILKEENKNLALFFSNKDTKRFRLDLDSFSCANNQLLTSVDFPDDDLSFILNFYEEFTRSKVFQPFYIRWITERINSQSEEDNIFRLAKSENIVKIHTFWMDERIFVVPKEEEINGPILDIPGDFFMIEDYFTQKYKSSSGKYFKDKSNLTEEIKNTKNYIYNTYSTLCVYQLEHYHEKDYLIYSNGFFVKNKDGIQIVSSGERYRKQ